MQLQPFEGEFRVVRLETAQTQTRFESTNSTNDSTYYCKISSFRSRHRFPSQMGIASKHDCQ